VIIPEEKLKDVSQLVATLEEQHVTRLVLVPSLLVAMLDSFDDLGTRLVELKYWFTSGEALSADLGQRFRKRIPRGILINLYGSSEVAGDVTCFDATKVESSHCVPIGRPIANTQTYVVDRYLRLTPVGIPGELLVGGGGLARGYHNLPELTAEKFIPNPFGNDARARLYRTGDLARYMPDGQIEILGRLDRQVKIRGHRIELSEIESLLAQHASVREAAVAAREDPAGDRKLVAYVSVEPDYFVREGGKSGVSGGAEQVLQWKTVWDEAYAEAPSTGDPTFNINGWNSAYDNLPIPVPEMQEWVEQTVEKIIALKPRTVLEIGCGTGLLLFRIAPYCTRYRGTDISSAALRYIEANLVKESLPQVSLTLQAADDFSGLEAESFDVVVLNSVVQYFPGVDYLLNVLRGALHLVRPGGAIFIGDVRSLPLLNAYHTSIELQRAPASLPLDHLKQRVQNRMIEEEELAVDPAFFLFLDEDSTQIASVRIEPKRGRHRNEMTRYRYDVTLNLGRKSGLNADHACMDWNNARLSQQALRQIVTEMSPDVLGIKRIPNAHLAKDIRTLELIDDSAGLCTISDLRHALSMTQEDGMGPDEAWAMGTNLAYKVQMQWAGSGSDDCYHLLLRRNGASCSELFPTERGPRKAWTHYVNNPLLGSYSRQLVPKLRRFLEDHLPDYMVPSAFVLLERLPLTPNGKLDWQRLPEPGQPRTEKPYIAPRMALEEVLARIYAEVLAVVHVGIDDNFFTELGGHSLLATQLVSRVRESLQVELALRLVFDNPTVRELTARLLDDISQRPRLQRTAELLLALMERSDTEIAEQLAHSTTRERA
jgi:SAM-dependent methyltransferase